jgi:5-methylcytosine-specific restriction endonuclease McrA
MKHERKVLLLSRSYWPIGLTTWQEAFCLLARNSAEVVQFYEDWEVNSASKAHKVPAVLVVLNNFKHVPKLKFNRDNLYFRDKHTCQYCGAIFESFSKKNLTYDHVHPRSKGGSTSWTNIVTACKSCNLKKGDSLLKDSGLFLKKFPEAPSQGEIVKYKVLNTNVQPEWEFYLAPILQKDEKNT